MPSKKIVDVAQRSSLELWQLTGANVVEKKEAVFAFSGLEYALFNKIVIKQNSALSVSSLEKLTRDPELPHTYSWMIPEKLCTDNVNKFLANKSFTHSVAMTSMQIALSATFESKVLVREAKCLSPMIDFWKECFGYTDHMANTYLTHISQKQAKNKLRHYFAYQNDLPVASGWLLFGDSAAGLFYIGTKPSAQNQGIGSGLVRFLLSKAYENGYSKAVLTALPPAKKLYQTIGFSPFEEYRLFLPISSKEAKNR